MVLRRSLPAILLLSLGAAPMAFGQLPTSPVAFVNQDAITVSLVPPLNEGGTEGGGGNNGDTNWLKVEWHYGATANFKNRYLDNVEFKIWIEGLDPDAANPSQSSGKGVAVGFTGDISYVNVPNSRDLYGVAYVHPFTLARYSRENGTEDYTRKFDVHVEMYVDGVLVDKIDKNKEKDPDWFKSLKPIPDLVYRMDQSPFISADVDRYPAMKMLNSSGK